MLPLFSNNQIIRFFLFFGDERSDGDGVSFRQELEGLQDSETKLKRQVQELVRTHSGTIDMGLFSVAELGKKTQNIIPYHPTYIDTHHPISSHIYRYTYIKWSLFFKRCFFWSEWKIRIQQSIDGMFILSPLLGDLGGCPAESSSGAPVSEIPKLVMTKQKPRHWTWWFSLAM